MPASIESRRKAFQALIENYYNDLSCEGEPVARHPVRFIELITKAGVLESAVVFDPRLTSTAFGAAAVSIARKIGENAKASRAFVDVEIVGQTAPVLLVSFDRTAPDVVTEALLAQLGGMALLCKPDDKIAPGLCSDLILYAVEPADQVVAEAVNQINAMLLAEATSLFAEPKEPVMSDAVVEGALVHVTRSKKDRKAVGRVLSLSRQHGGHPHRFRSSGITCKFPSAAHAAKFRDALSAADKADKDAGAAEDAKMAKPPVDEALALHAYVHGADALAHLDESARGQAALAYMMRAFSPAAAPVQKDSPFAQVIARAKALTETVVDHEALVDEVALAADAAGAVDVICQTVAEAEDRTPELEKLLGEDVHVRADLLQRVARHVLLGEGKVPANLSTSFEKLVAHIKAVTA